MTQEQVSTPAICEHGLPITPQSALNSGLVETLLLHTASAENHLRLSLGMEILARLAPPTMCAVTSVLGYRVRPYLKNVLQTGGRGEGSTKGLPTTHEGPGSGLQHHVRHVPTTSATLTLGGAETGGSSELTGQSF